MRISSYFISRKECFVMYLREILPEAEIQLANDNTFGKDFFQFEMKC